METADAAAIGMLADEVLAPEVIELALSKLTDMLDGPAEDVAARRARLTESLRHTKTELWNLSRRQAVAGPLL